MHTKNLVLSLEAEYRLRDVLPAPDDGRFEASGVVAVGRWLWVVFDNTRRVARLPIALDARGTWFDLPGSADGFEDIAYSTRTRSFLLLVESMRRGGAYISAIDEYSSRWRFLRRRTIEGALLRKNKGYEGIACVKVGNAEFVLAVRERSKGPATHVDVLRPAEKSWRVARTIALPAIARFRDYSAVAVSRRRIAVLSQEDAKVWLSTLTSDASAAEDGVVVDFPRSRKKHKRRYYTLEGLTWVSDDRIVVVSDRAKRSLPRRAFRRHESIAVFRLVNPREASPSDSCGHRNGGVL